MMKTAAWCPKMMAAFTMSKAKENVVHTTTGDGMPSGFSGSIKSLCEACAGVSGAWIAILFTYPMELAKTRVQLQTKGLSKTSYAGTVDALITIFRRQGLEGSYRGVRGEVTKETLKQFTSFFFYTQFKEIDRRRKEKLRNQTLDPRGHLTNVPDITAADDSAAKHERKVEFWMKLLYGIVSSTITVLVTNPFNVAQVRIQARTKKDVDAQYGLLSTVLHLIKTNGASSLWSGLGPSLLLVLNPALQLAVNDYLVLTYRRFKRARIEASRRRSITSAMQQERQQRRLSRQQSNSRHMSSISEAGDKQQSSSSSGVYSSVNGSHDRNGGFFQTSGAGGGSDEDQIPEEDLKHDLWVDKSEYYQLSALEYFVIGAAAKGVATVVTYPMILAKVLQSYKGDASERQFNSTLHALGSVIRSEGILGIYKGLQAQLTKSVMSSAILFMTKAKLEKLIWIPLFVLLLRVLRRNRS